MSEFVMPTPPDGCFWRVKAKRDMYGFLWVKVSLREHIWFGSFPLGSRSFMVDGEDSPHHNADRATRAARAVLRETAKYTDPKPNLVDLNGLQGVEFGRNTIGDAIREAESD